MFYINRFIVFIMLELFCLFSHMLWINTFTYNSVYFIYAKNKSDCYSQLVELEHKFKQLIRTSEAHSQRLIQLQQQLSENQQDTDILRGNIQEMQHHISEIVYNQQDILKKINHLFNDNNRTQLFNKNIKQALISNNDSEKDHINNELNDKKINDNNDSIDYKAAVALVLEKKQYVQAIQSFQDFIKNHPQSYYQPNAYYWLGQLFYNQGKKNDASYYFAWVVKHYPKSSKASDALLKIGFIMEETNQQDKSETVYRQVIKLYPNSDSAKHARKRLERFIK